MDFETYSRSKRSDYADLADTVASILRAAIAAHPFRLQLVQARGKDPDSLKKKLEQRGLLATTTLEKDIKDLAGCRLIFYSNADVTRFQQSGIIRDNFDVDWDRTKIHHPVPGDGDQNLFISDNFVVFLKEDRTKLAEYARFAGLACEVQVQTTLNHTWSEMEHDILYKRPKLTGFGGKLFEAIEKRFETIMKTYLLPAGYEFQKALSDYDRLMSGKELFDRGALKALVDCADNNERLDLLERFRDYVLPNYDDYASVYAEIKDGIIAAIKAARLTKPREIETPGGNFPGSTVSDVVKVACEILGIVRYVSIEGTFEAICDVFPGTLDGEERRHLLDLTHQLARHELEVWKRAGAIVQTTLVRQVRDFDQERALPVLPVLLKVLEDALGTEVEGTTGTYNTVTFHRGSVLSSDALRTMRSEAIDILCKLYAAAISADERSQIKRVLFAAIGMPTSASYSKELLADVLNDSARVVCFFTSLAGGNDYEIIQSIEYRLLWMHRRAKGFENGKETDAAVLAAADRLNKSILAFRKTADANTEFVTYKTLVGFESVFPPMWDSDSLQYEKEQEYRSKRIDELVAEVTEKNADEWLAIINRCAGTRSNDMATFPSFGEFLQRLGREKPSIMLGYIDKMGEPLTRFLGVMLSGLAQSSQAAALDTRIEKWLSEDRYLVEIAHYFKFAPRLDESMLKRLLEAGGRLNDENVVAQVLETVCRRYKEGTKALLNNVILPGITYFTQKKDARWVNVVWFVPKKDSFVRDLSDEGVEIVLQNLMHAPRIDTHDEFILVAIADARPTRVFDFFEERLKFSASAETESRYEPIPYEFYELKNSFQGIADHAVDTARRLFVGGDYMFRFNGARLISAAFPAFSDSLNRKLKSLVESGTHDDLEFVVRVLSSYDGEPFVEPLCKEIIRRLPSNDPLRTDVELVLQATGTVMGEFGLVEAYRAKRDALAPWLSDADEKVRSFAQDYIASLDRQMAAEQRRSEEELEMRKRRYEEPEKEEDSRG